MLGLFPQGGGAGNVHNAVKGHSRCKWGGKAAGGLACRLQALERPRVSEGGWAVKQKAVPVICPSALTYFPGSSELEREKHHSKASQGKGVQSEAAGLPGARVLLWRLGGPGRWVLRCAPWALREVSPPQRPGLAPPSAPLLWAPLKPLFLEPTLIHL